MPQHPRLIVRLAGGLGNQLFTYAAARRLALVSDAELVLDDVSGFTHDHRYRRFYQLHHFRLPGRTATPQERLEPFARVRRRLLRTWHLRRPFAERRYIVPEGVDFDPRLLGLRVQGTAHMEGGWQSERYFEDVASTLRQDLTLVPPTDGVNTALAARIQACNGVAVHVRFFEAPDAQGVHNAAADYYERAVAHLEARHPNAHYFVFSDRPADARARIRVADDRVTLVNHNVGDAMAHADLWLMSLCRHFIIANSTFSWWGAWLARAPEKCVIAPGIELRHGDAYWGFEGLLPEAWVKL